MDCKLIFEIGPVLSLKKLSMTGTCPSCDSLTDSQTAGTNIAALIPLRVPAALRCILSESLSQQPPKR